MWPVCQFPGQAQQPTDSRYLLFLWQLGRRCACWPDHHIWRFCSLLPGYYFAFQHYCMDDVNLVLVFRSLLLQSIVITAKLTISRNPYMPRVRGLTKMKSAKSALFPIVFLPAASAAKTSAVLLVPYACWRPGCITLLQGLFRGETRWNAVIVEKLPERIYHFII